MSIFSKLKSDGLEQTEDRLGGYRPFETGIYTGIIKMAYAGKAASGAQNVTILFESGGREYRETIYVTNKNGENWFLNKEDKSKKVPLPGFTTVEDICLAATGVPLAEQDVEDKMVKIYDMEAKKELPKSVPVIVSLLGKEVSLGIVKNLENKSTKNGNGEYVPTAEERTTNTIEKVFNTATKLTVPEARQGLEAGVFWDAWLEKNQGVTRDKRSIKDGAGGQQGRPGGSSTPPQAGATPAPKKSLFGGNKAA